MEIAEQIIKILDFKKLQQIPYMDVVSNIILKYPKTSIFVGNTLLLGYLYRYYQRSPYPSPWRDRRVLSANMTRKKMCETDFKAELACTEEWDVVIIGSGGSGLVSANLLSRAGLKVLVLEKHYNTGGCLHAWEDKGFEWDTGVHYVGSSIHQDSNSGNGKILKFLTDGKLKWEKLEDIFDIVKLRDETGHMDAYPIEQRKNKVDNTWDTLESMLKENFPDDHQAIDDFIKSIFDVDAKALGIYKVMPKWLVTLAMKFGLHRKYLDNSALDTSVKEHLDSLTDNKKLKCVLNYLCLDYGTTPAKAPKFLNLHLFAHFMDGGYFPTGGSQHMVECLAEPIWARGGKILIRSHVKEILIENGTAVGVRVLPCYVGNKNTGEEFIVRAKHVLSTASIWHTNDMIKEASLRMDIDHLTPGPGAFYVFFGMNENCPQLPTRNYWLYNTKESDLDITLDKFFELDLESYLDAPAPAIFLSFPSAKDSDYKNRHPKGQTGCIISTAKFDWYTELVPDHLKRWGVSWKKIRMDRPAEYVAIRDRIGRRLVEEAQEFVPEVNFLEHVDFISVGSTMTQRQYLNVYRGAIYSADHDLARFKPENLVKTRPETPVKNLTQGGQDILSCGVSTTLTTGMMAAGHILNQNLVIQSKAVKKTL